MDSPKDQAHAAYRATAFWVSAPRGRFAIRIDELSSEVDALLDADSCTSWAYVTAYNPHAELLADHENRLRHDELRSVVGDAGFAAFDGEGIGNDGEWPPERSLLVLGISKPEALELGRRFDQEAIVSGARGELARLVFCA